MEFNRLKAHHAKLLEQIGATPELAKQSARSLEGALAAAVGLKTVAASR
jgi:hypothetical protein